MEQNRLPYIVRLAVILIVLVLLVTVLYYLKIVLVPLLFSIIFAVMLYPFAIRLEKWGFAKGLAAFVTVLITTALLGYLVYLMFIQLSSFFQQMRSEEHTSELQSLAYLVCRLLLEKKKNNIKYVTTIHMLILSN